MKENKSGVYVVEEEWLFEHIVRGAARVCACVRGARRYDGVRNDCATLPARAWRCCRLHSCIDCLSPRPPGPRVEGTLARNVIAGALFINILIIYHNNDNNCQKKVNVLS